MEWWLNLLSGGGLGWIEAALLVCLFWAALVHPDRVRSWLEFRVASWLLAAAIVAPVIVQLAFTMLGGAGPVGPTFGPRGGIPRGAGRDLSVEMMMYGVAIPPLLLMLAVILAVDSVISRSKRAGG